MTLTRPVHYAPDPWAADFADRRGILLIPEIPGLAGERATALESAISRAREAADAELIEQYGNHPERVRVERAQRERGRHAGRHPVLPRNARLHQEPRSRALRHAGRRQPAEARARRAVRRERRGLPDDESVFRRLARPARSARIPRSTRWTGCSPTKMVIISEFGFPGIFAKNPTEADAMRVSRSCASRCRCSRKRDWIAGAILWCYQDYKSRRYYWPGQEQGYLEHGIVDPNRQRKPSYFAWQELNAPAHIEARWTRGADGAPAVVHVRRSRRTDPAELPSYRALQRLSPRLAARSTRRTRRSRAAAPP